jgi:hypothetical protein
MKRKNKFFKFLPLFIALTVFLGCITTPTDHVSERNYAAVNFDIPTEVLTGVVVGEAIDIPISNQILDEVGGLGVSHLFQYYVSKNITLTLIEDTRYAHIEDGRLVETSRTARHQVEILSHLPGLVRRHQVRNIGGASLNYFNVAFEHYAGDPVLLFGPYDQGAQERYELLFMDSDNRIVQYGHARYAVSWDGFDLPYILIKKLEVYSDYEDSRNVTGLRLGE